MAELTRIAVAYLSIIVTLMSHNLIQNNITTPLTFSLVLHIVKLSCVEYIADLEMTFSVNPPEA